MDLSLAAAKYRLGLTSASDLPRIGMDALEDGFDSPTLRQLAAESGTDDNISERLFAKTLEELGLAMPSQDLAGMIVSESIAREVVIGQLDPYEGARYIWSNVYIHNPNLKRLRVFVGLASEYEDHPEQRDYYLAEILKECRALTDR